MMKAQANPPQGSAAGYVLVALAACMWGVLGPLSKYIFAQGVEPLETAFWRAVLAWFMFAAHALKQGKVKAAPRDLPAIFAFGVVGVAVFYGSYQLSINDCGAALASVLLYTAPAWVAVLSLAFLGERLGGLKLAAVAMTVVGVIGVSLGPALADGGSVDFTAWGVVFGLTAGLTYALYYIFGKKYLPRYSTPTLFLYALPVGAAGLAPFIHFAHKTPEAWIGLFFLAFLSTYGAYSVYYAGLRRIEATRAAVTATLEPVTAAVVAFFWWGEMFSWAGYAGSALILAAVLVIVLDGTRASRALNGAGEAGK